MVYFISSFPAARYTPLRLRQSVYSPSLRFSLLSALRRRTPPAGKSFVRLSLSRPSFSICVHFCLWFSLISHISPLCRSTHRLHAATVLHSTGKPSSLSLSLYCALSLYTSNSVSLPFPVIRPLFPTPFVKLLRRRTPLPYFSVFYSAGVTPLSHSTAPTPQALLPLWATRPVSSSLGLSLLCLSVFFLSSPCLSQPAAVAGLQGFVSWLVMDFWYLAKI